MDKVTGLIPEVWYDIGNQFRSNNHINHIDMANQLEIEKALANGDISTVVAIHGMGHARTEGRKQFVKKSFDPEVKKVYSLSENTTSTSTQGVRKTSNRAPVDSLSDLVREVYPAVLK